MSERNLEVFDADARESRFRNESWQVYACASVKFNPKKPAVKCLPTVSLHVHFCESVSSKAVTAQIFA